MYRERRDRNKFYLHLYSAICDGCCSDTKEKTEAEMPDSVYLALADVFARQGHVRAPTDVMATEPVADSRSVVLLLME